MRRMKSRLVRVKVWYEHVLGLAAELQATGVERELSLAIVRGLRKDQASDVEIHNVQIGSETCRAARPEPDF